MEDCREEYKSQGGHVEGSMDHRGPDPVRDKTDRGHLREVCLVGNIDNRHPKATMLAAANGRMVLVGTDDSRLADRVCGALCSGGFSTVNVEDGERAVRIADERPPRMFLLGQALPPESGLAVCRRLRRKADLDNVPIVMLARDDDTTFRIAALESGADGCIMAFQPVAAFADRVRAFIRRADGATPCDVRIRLGDMELDCAARQVWRNGRAIAVRPTEFLLLRTLMSHPDRVFSRSELLNAAWPEATRLGPRTVDVQMARLRRVLGADAESDPIRTVRTVGYAISG